VRCGATDTYLNEIYDGCGGKLYVCSDSYNCDSVKEARGEGMAFVAGK
jgi:alpha-D-ribose 1-methylphosphonate 5-phosphate C-P lyase